MLLYKLAGQTHSHMVREIFWEGGRFFLCYNFHPLSTKGYFYKSYSYIYTSTSPFSYSPVTSLIFSLNYTDSNIPVFSLFFWLVAILRNYK